MISELALWGLAALAGFVTGDLCACQRAERRHRKEIDEMLERLETLGTARDLAQLEADLLERRYDSIRKAIVARTHVSKAASAGASSRK